MEGIYEFTPPDFARASQVFALLDYHLSVRSALAGESPARMWADDPENPQSALLQIGHRYYLAGNASRPGFLQALKGLFSGILLLAHRTAGQPWFVLYHQDGWDAAAHQALAECELFPEERQYYEIQLRPEMLLPQPDLPAGFSLASADRSLLDRPDLGARQALEDEMRSERPSVEAFLEKSFGVCLLYAGAVAGWCLSEYNLGERCEVGIATAEPFQRRGLATVQGLALLRQALDAGIRRVGWHCMKNNIGSARTALKLGFDWLRDYPAFFVHF